MKYLVALAVGGIMEKPEFTYEDPQIIEAEDKKDAERIYEKINECTYFGAKCLGEIIEKDGKHYLLHEIKLEAIKSKNC